MATSVLTPTITPGAIGGTITVPPVVPPIIPPATVNATALTPGQFSSAAPIPGVSSAVSNAVNSTLASGYTPPASTSQFGSSAGIAQGTTLNTSLTGAAASLQTPPATTPQPTTTTQKALYSPQTNPDGSYNPNGGQLIGYQQADGSILPAGNSGASAPISNPAQYTGLYNPDGTPQTNPGGYVYPTTGVNPALAPTYQQATDATNTANAQYQSDLAATQRALQANIDALTQDKQNAITAAEASYDTNNPEGGGSDKQEYLASVGANYDKQISEATADMNTQLTNLSIAHQSALQNINEQVTQAVATNTANTYNAGLTTLQTLEKGDGTALSPFDNATLLQQLTAGGMTPQQAQLQIDSSIAQAQTAQNKTLTTEERQERSSAITALNGSLSRITDSTVASQDPTIINQVLAAGYVGDPIGYDSQGNPAYTDAQRQQASQYILSQNIKPVTTAANIAFKNTELAQKWATIQQNGQYKNLGALINFWKGADISQESLDAKAAFSQQLQADGLDQATADAFANTGSIQTQPVTTTTGGSVNVLGVKSGTTSTKTKGGDTGSSTSSSSNNSNNPLGI